MQRLMEKSPRIEVVDALRGFAVMAIILVHNIEHFIIPIYPDNSPEWLNSLDQVVFNVTFSLFAGKAYAIFALLFGFTFYIQTNNQKKQGKDFGYRFLWRMVLLVFFATLNAAFFPAGDVLLLFAIVSLVLFLPRNLSDRAIIITSIIFLLQPVELYHYIASHINPAHQLPDLKIEEMYAEVAAYTKAGNFGDFLLGNITLGQKASLFWAIHAGRLCQTAGLFLLGFYIGRKQLFVSSEKNIRIWTYTLIVAAISLAPLHTLRDFIIRNVVIGQQPAETAFDMWQKLAFSLVLVSAFVILYQNKTISKAVGNLRFYGKMSLTNYITQSIIGTAIYSPFGVFLASYCGYTVSLLIGIFTFFLQVFFCKWWLSRHKQGPLEYIWHKWTWIGTGK